MATAIEEDKRAKRMGPAGFAPGVDVAAPLNLTAPGTMQPDAPTPVATQPAPQFTRTNAGPLLQTPAAPPVVPAAPDPVQQQLANQTAMYVQGAQAAAAARPAPTPVAPAAPVVAAAPAAAPAVDPMAGQAAFVPPRMGRRDPAPLAAPVASAAPTQGAWEPSQAMRDALPAAAPPPSVRPAAPTLAPPPPAAPPASTANGFRPVGENIYRRGNTFTDAAGTQDASFRPGRPVSPQNEAAANALAARYTTPTAVLAASQAQPRGFVPADVQPRQFDRAASIRALSDLRSPEAIALRNLRIDAEQEGEAARAAGRAWKGGTPAGDAYRALIGELTAGTREGQQAEMRNQTDVLTTGMREAGAILRTGLGEQGSNTRAGMTNEIQQGELGLKREAQGFTTRAAGRLEKAQADYMAADTPEKKAAAAKVIRELQGKEKPESWKGVALQGGTDALGNKTESVLAAVNEATGEMRKFNGGAAQAQTPAYAEGQLLKGKDGKTYIVKNGEPVLAK